MSAAAAVKPGSSMNALRHGLTAKQIVLPGEDAEEYEVLREDTIKTYKPANTTEAVLVEELCAASWRLMRARGQETAILEKLLGERAGSHAEFATLFIEKPKEIARLTRYITTIERAYYRALSKLDKMQQERKKEERALAIQESWLQSLREQETPDDFVSHKSEIQPAEGFIPVPCPPPAAVHTLASGSPRF
jgi:hypothetical protein